MAQTQIPTYSSVKIADTASTPSTLVSRDTDQSINVGAVNCTSISASQNLALSLATKTADYTLAAETVILVSGVTTLTLPPAAGCTGRVYIIKKTDATNTLTIDPNGSETIDGSATSITSTTQWETWRLYSNGTAWFKL